MRTISNIYLSQGTNDVTQTLVSGSITKPSSLIDGEQGNPKTKKTTPAVPRVSMLELELNYLHNPVISNGINKIVQTIMSGEHVIAAKDKRVLSYFNNFVENLGSSGSYITWEEILSLTYKYQCIYGWSWIENIFNEKGNRIVDWDIIDPKTMDYARESNDRMALDKFSRPLGYVQSLPYDFPLSNSETRLPEHVRGKVMLPNNGLFLEPKQIALIKMFKIGDGFYPIGLVEPAYKASLRKLNIEEALANAIWRHGFPIFLAKLGDDNHAPTPQLIQSILEKMRDASHKQEMAVPYYYDISILESKKSEKLREHLEYFRQQEVTALGIPMPYATGGGEACYSEDTLTLTENGWKFHYEIKKDEKIATFNPETKEIEYHNYLHKELFDYKGLMHHYDYVDIDILVTPKHKMYYCINEQGPWIKRPSEEIKEDSINFLSCTEKEGKITIDNRCKKFNRSFDLKETEYDGKVYCYEVPNHLYITKRNGAITIQGNTNRSTLTSQGSMYMLTLKDIIAKTVCGIRKFMFEPICRLEGFKEVPTIEWDLVGSELDEKGKRLTGYVKGGVLTAEDVREIILKLEKIGGK